MDDVKQSRKKGVIYDKGTHLLLLDVRLVPKEFHTYARDSGRNG